MTLVPNDAFDRTFRDLLRPISSLLQQERVTEILVNRYDEIYVEEAGHLRRTSLGFRSEADLLALLRALSQFVGREIGPESPILEARLPDGSRVQGVLAPTSVTGPLLAIRRHATTKCSIESLVDDGVMSRDALVVLRRLVEARRSILVAGPPGSGKTTLLGALIGLVLPEERVLLVEDPPELQLCLPHVVRLQARSSTSGASRLTVGHLLGTSLRLRPDRIVLGELDQSGAFDLVQAIIAGHSGCFATVSAVRPEDALTRLEAMAIARSHGLDAATLQSQIANAIDAIVLLARSSDGVRRVSTVCRVTGCDAQRGYRLSALYPSASEVGSEVPP